MQAYRSRFLKEFDHVIIQWSSPYRFDYLTKQGWTFPDGNIKISLENKHIWKKIKTWYNDNFELEKTLNYMKAVDDLIENKVFLSMTDLPYENILLNNLQSKYKGNYKLDNYVDPHPSVRQHIAIALHVANELNLKVDEEKQLKALKLDSYIQKKQVFREYEFEHAK